MPGMPPPYKFKEPKAPASPLQGCTPSTLPSHHFLEVRGSNPGGSGGPQAHLGCTRTMAGLRAQRMGWRAPDQPSQDDSGKRPPPRRRLPDDRDSPPRVISPMQSQKGHWSWTDLRSELPLSKQDTQPLRQVRSKTMRSLSDEHLFSIVQGKAH